MIRDWNPRPIENELALAKRYCEAVCPYTGAAREIAFGGRWSTNLMFGIVTFEVEKRTLPSLVHNISTTWAATTPTGTEAAAFLYATSSFVTITGTLSLVFLSEPSLTATGFGFSASTSFSGSAGNLIEMVVGPDVIVILEADM